ncbi:MAG: hypothetical protein SH857_14040 [Chitinophagales bacterium]|nr:hypothetical protein [Chitinophagales bacterium]
MTQKITSTFLVIILLFSAMGCKKWRDNRETLTSEDHTLAEACFNDIFRNVLTATSPVGELLTDSCFTITKSGSTFPQTITIDFGSAGCEGLFGEDMQGRIVIVLSDSLNHTGAIAAVSLENFFSNLYNVQGSLNIENTGLNTEGLPEYHLEVEEGIITAEENKAGEDFSISWVGEYHHSMMMRDNPLFLLDDLYHITGSASGINQEGRAFTATITEDLQKYFNCRWPGSGVANIAPDDLDERELSYGECDVNSTCCDNIASELVKWPDQTVRMK